MRFGIVLHDRALDEAVLADELGFDLAWLDEQTVGAPLVVAAAAASRTSGIRLAAAVVAGGAPVALAEDAAVADLATGGRLVLVVGGDDEPLLRETVELLFHAFAARPFHHPGPRWPTPVRLPEHEHAESRVRVTPTTAQLELPIWLRGPAAPRVAREGGLAFVDESGDPGPDWDRATAALGLAAARLRRPAIRLLETDPDGGFDPDPVVLSLRAEQDAWGLDVAIFSLAPALAPSARERSLRLIATEVRPTLQLDRLPVGLEALWRERRE